MEKIFFFNKFIAAGSCLFVFYRQFRLQVLQRKKTTSKLLAAWINTAIGYGSLLLAAEMVPASPWNLKNNAFLFILHEMIARYCKLRGSIKDQKTKVFSIPRLIEPGHLKVIEKSSENTHFKLHQVSKKTVIVRNSQGLGISLYQKAILQI